ncbi:hypothetical protein AltI4_43650 [Alteromonas sp. I4]|nr:hypothetical protein AltI4_43650 [Alteromonas sp. I4]
MRTSTEIWQWMKVKIPVFKGVKQYNHSNFMGMQESEIEQKQGRDQQILR